jgi:hypothetical protein
MRLAILIVVLAVAAAADLWAGSVSAQYFEGQGIFFGRRTGPQAPWCSHEDTGGGNVAEDCSFDSFEQCRQIAMGVNNTFCTQNPTYDVNVRVVRRKKGNRQGR